MKNLTAESRRSRKPWRKIVPINHFIWKTLSLSNETEKKCNAVFFSYIKYITEKEIFPDMLEILKGELVLWLYVLGVHCNIYFSFWG